MTAPIAGWYHDPTDSGSWRWWDGGTWTPHVHPKAEPTAPVVVAQPLPHPVAVQPASPTPETPVSEQEYWHSPGAEVVLIPGRSATVHGSHFAAVRSVGRGPNPYRLRQWGDVGSPQTAGIWLLAFLPIMSVALQMAFSIVFVLTQGTTGASSTQPGIVLSAILLGLSWIFAGLDVRALGARGYDAPKIWWMLLLPPLVYFIARGRVVRREGQRAWPPELLYFLSILGFIMVGVLTAVFAMSMLSAMVPSQLA